MWEAVVFILGLGSDWLLKSWSMSVLASMQGYSVDVIPGILWLTYSENHADNVSFIRGRSAIMNIVRILQVVIILYLLIRQRKKLAPITRIALGLFLAGLVGNQANYILMGFVPDMLVIAAIPRIVFNLADVFVMISMVILFIRLAFFEGQDFVSWLLNKLGKDKPDVVFTKEEVGAQETFIIEWKNDAAENKENYEENYKEKNDDDHLDVG